MSIIHPNTLFHFTSKCSTLKLIVKSGLRFSYCLKKCRMDMDLQYL